ncbi:MAG: TetR/AcrR family transcriptional regulator [Planctomycetota bacterium]
MTERKDQLRAAVLDHLLKHGVASASLRPMAAALGTSARILMFHFKSKEALLQETLEELQLRLRASFASMVDPGPRRVSPLKRFWLWAASPQNAPCLRLLYEAQIIAIQNPTKYGHYLAESSANWLAMSLKAMSEPLRSGPMARLCIAVFDGLMLEYLSTGNLRATTQALDHFIALARLPQDPAVATRRRPARAK